MNGIVARMWLGSFFVMLFVMAGWALYVAEQAVSPLSYDGIATIFAATGTILFGLSFLLGPIGHFFDFLDRKVAYRKQLGLWGYYCALIYSVMLMFTDLDFYYYGFFKNFFTADIFFGVTAMIIFTVMALISNAGMMKLLGNSLWRKILRLGYIAYAFLVIRAILIEWDLWVAWWEMGEGLPPVRIPLCIFATAVIMIRIIMRLHIDYRAHRVVKKVATAQ